MRSIHATLSLTAALGAVTACSASDLLGTISYQAESRRICNLYLVRRHWNTSGSKCIRKHHCSRRITLCIIARLQYQRDSSNCTLLN